MMRWLEFLGGPMDGRWALIHVDQTSLSYPAGGLTYEYKLEEQYLGHGVRQVMRHTLTVPQ